MRNINMNNSNNNKLLRLGMAQIDCALGEVEKNIEKTIKIAEENKSKTDLLVFPELSLTGYSVGKDFHRYALRLDDPIFKKLVKSIKGITVAVGMIEETSSFDFFNSLVFIKNGEIIHTHRKIYLPNYDIFEEKKYFSTGSHFQSFDLPPFRIAPFVCGDAWNPALAHIAAADAANVFVFSACSPDYKLGGKLSNDESWKLLSQFYAMIYGSYVIFVNRVGSERDIIFHGHSMLVDPFGEVVSRLNKEEESVSIEDINLDKVREARTTLHTMRDENLGFVRDQLSKVIHSRSYL